MTREGWAQLLTETNLRFLLDGLLVTLELTGLAAGISLVLGFLLAGYRFLAPGPARWPATLFVGAFRNLPVLVVMFFVRFGLPLVGVSIRSAFLAAVIALVAYNTAMVAELLRGSVESVGRGQNEAALAGGLTRPSAFLWVVLPQGSVRALPALAGQFIVLLQGTSLVTALGVTDLTDAGARIYTRYVNPLETLIVVGATYFVLCAAVAYLRRILERRFSIFGSELASG